MAMSLNMVQLIGNLTRDPELKQIPGGQVVASFAIATNMVWSDQNGQKQEKVEYHNIVAWRRLAEICGQYLKKGSKIYLQGRLQTRSWEGEDGVKRYRTEIVADNLIMLDKKGEPVAMPAMMDRENSGISQSSGAKSSGAQPVSADQGEEVSLDDLPF